MRKIIIIGVICSASYTTAFAQIPEPNCVCAYCEQPCGSGHTADCKAVTQQSDQEYQSQEDQNQDSYETHSTPALEQLINTAESYGIDTEDYMINEAVEKAESEENDPQ